ncbi:MAG: 2OG-Fe(II) oxygenase family protein [Rhodospirillaceae bacterium]
MVSNNMIENKGLRENGMQATDFKLSDGTFVWWTTPILKRRLPDTAGVNSELKKIVLERAESSRTVQKSNEGGWHSDEDLLSWGGPAIAQLQRWIVEGFQDLTTAMSGGQPYKGNLELNAWANLNRAGNYNNIHTHPACVWSGVYYVEVGDPPTERHPKSGAIEFFDPRAGAEMVALPGLPFSQQKLINPSSGQIIMFPSWLKHLVHPYWGEQERISIAFNIRMRPNL